MVHFRQPQVRWAWAAADRVRVAVALENPTTEVDGLTAANRRPDFVSRIRWNRGAEDISRRPLCSSDPWL